MGEGGGREEGGRGDLVKIKLSYMPTPLLLILRFVEDEAGALASWRHLSKQIQTK